MSVSILGLPRSAAPADDAESAAGDASPSPHRAAQDDAAALALLEQLPPDAVLVVPAWAGADGLRRLRRARKLTERTDLALLPRDRPASRLLLATRLLQGSALFAPAECSAALDLVDAALATTALVDSVGGLVTPVPSLAQHALGAVPGTRFLVDLEAQQVRRIGSRMPTPDGPSGGSAVLCFGLPTAATWVEELLERVQPAQVEAEPPFDGPDGRFWGTARWVELTVLREPADDLLDRVRHALPPLACPSCGRRAAGPSCLFCGVVPVAASSSPRTDVRPLAEVPR